MTIQLSFDPREITDKLLSVLTERAADILRRRYGMGKSVRRETLETVGIAHSITRERVRQIEIASIRTIRGSDVRDELAPVFTELAGAIKDLGSIIAERTLLEALSDDEAVHNHIHFLLVIGDSFNRLKENEYWVHRWHDDTEVPDIVHTALEELHRDLRKDELFTDSEIVARLHEKIGDAIDEAYLTEEIGLHWLELSKKLRRNILGDWGKVGAYGINTRGIRDMAWLILRRHGSPMHFSEVADEIGRVFGRKTGYPTAHNELIRDDRFVLVGRGLYALTEWGYVKGTVKEVIQELLAKNGPMSRDDLIDAVKRERYVRASTITHALQDSELFTRDEDGNYMLSGIVRNR